MDTNYRLVPPSGGEVAVPTLDAYQRRVVDHPGGPLLVLAGPGTGKTTTMVEAIVDRIERRGASPEEVLALTFSRKAAEQLRDRVTARLGRTTSSALCSTFHSFAYGLIRAHAPADLYESPLVLLSAPEQDVVLRELLEPHRESVAWPESFSRAVTTRGFAREVGAVLARAREKGMDAEELTRLGRDSGAPELVAAGAFLESYLTILDSQGAIDYPDLIRRAVLEAQAHQAELRRRYRYVFVDEYQDTDPGQVELLRALAGDGGDLVVVGDPHQSIYGFRGAEVRGILDFPTEFPTRSGAPAPVEVLRTTRRFGPVVLEAAQRVASYLSLPGSIPIEARKAFAEPQCAAGEVGPGSVQVRTFDTERAEAEHLADLLRRAHLDDGIDWDEMAVLVRSGRASIPPLRRALVAAGVPVEVAADDTPLAQDPAVLPLLDALRVVVGWFAGDEPEDDEQTGESERRVTNLLTGPLCGLDAADVRRLARRLRAHEKDRVAEAGGSPRTSPELLREAVLSADLLDGIESAEAERARDLHALLARAGAAVREGQTAEEVLWLLWDGTGWPHRLRAAAESGGAAGRRAHRDLDAVLALFEAAARASEQRHHTGVAAFLPTLIAQQLPADTLAEQGVRGSAVRLLTAHRSKGLQWRLVVVAHVQAEGWPDLRRRGSLLEPDRIGSGELVPPVGPRELLREERRLFYVACTRARERLVVTAVASPDDDGEQPSRFLSELTGLPLQAGLDGDPAPAEGAVPHVVGRPRRPMSLEGLVADLRRTVTDPDAAPALRDAAAKRLASLAEVEHRGRALVPQADPDTWWGLRRLTRAETALRDPDAPLPVSASVLTALDACPLRWFLEREAGGVLPSPQSANLGQLIHALAARVASGELARPEIGLEEAVEELMAYVDGVWPRFSFRTPWSADREYARTRNALRRFVSWHRTGARQVSGVEQRFSVVVPVAGAGDIRISGYADRVEFDAEGRPVVVDLKTGRTMPSGPEVAQHVQLGLYQYAGAHGAFPHPASEGASDHSTTPVPGGAELVQLGLEDGSDQPRVQAQEPQTAPARERLEERLVQAAAMLRAEEFPARPDGKVCRTCTFEAVCPSMGAGAVIGR